MPLAQLQDGLEMDGRVNVLLLSAAAAPDDDGSETLQRLVRRHTSSEDIGLRVRPIAAQPPPTGPSGGGQRATACPLRPGC